jgi:hypothetical protein
MAQQMTIPLHSLTSHNGITLEPKQIARREDAQSLVELALLMPLFLLLLLGSTEVARFAWTAVLTANAARAGAAYGCQSVITATDLAGIQAVALKDGVNLVNLNTTRTLSCACSNGTATPDCSKAASVCSATILNYVQVNTTSTVSVFGKSFTATGQSTMVIEQ